MVLDAAPGPTLLELLDERRITHIHDLILSHADTDHIAGAVTLLSEKVAVEHVFLNADSSKDTVAWRDLRFALADARKRGTTKILPSLTSAQTPFRYATTEIEVLAPNPEIAMSGVGGSDLGGVRLDTNTMSVVLRISCAGRAEVLLPGDLDSSGLDRLLADHPQPRARVLIFPHHGGRPGQANPTDFARRLCVAVQPELVLFSTGRGKHGTPRPEIIAGVRAAVPEAHIACTQLSEHCAAALPARPAAYAQRYPSRGRARNACCAGTIALALGLSDLALQPGIAAHRGFVTAAAPSALCRRSTLRVTSAT